MATDFEKYFFESPRVPAADDDCSADTKNNDGREKERKAKTKLDKENQTSEFRKSPCTRVVYD